MKNDIIENFANSLIVDCGDIATDFVEDTIDSFWENEVVNKIPFVKVLKTIVKGCFGIRECHLIKNTVNFINELQKCGCDKNTIQKFKKRALKSNISFEHELERVLFVLDKQTENQKLIFLARLFYALLNDEININTFRDYVEILDHILVGDIKVVQDYWGELNSEGLLFVKKQDVRSFNRLSYQGI